MQAGGEARSQARDTQLDQALQRFVERRPLKTPRYTPPDDPNGSGATAGLLRSIQRDAAGRITGYTHTNGGNPATGFDQGFGYDNLDRLTSATQASATTQYSYDDNGNRTARTVAGTTYTNTLSATSNRLAQVQDASGTASINHEPRAMWWATAASPTPTAIAAAWPA